MNTVDRVSQPLAPEDIEPGQYIVQLRRICEYVPYFSMDEFAKERTEPYRMVCMPKTAVPLRVVQVCLPFLLVITTAGKRRTVDTRRAQFARVSAQFGDSAFADKPASELSDAAGMEDENGRYSGFE